MDSKVRTTIHGLLAAIFVCGTSSSFGAMPPIQGSSTIAQTSATAPIKLSLSDENSNSIPPVTANLTDSDVVQPRLEPLEPTGAAAESEAESEQAGSDDLFDLDIEELGKLKVGEDPVFEAESLNSEVMSIDGTKSTVGQSPGAVYVLTDEMIRRSGVRTIPDALRLVPGVQVARLNSQAYSVSIRGFAGSFNNKVLVQVDGRMIYNQTYGGVMWDIHELILEDIERIEVIRGPGATVWGENAVNGVINIVTKSAQDTIGNYFTAGAGNEERQFYAFSIGRKWGNDLSYRIYGKYNERYPGLILDPISVPFGYFPDDGGFLGRLGYRSDYTPTENDRVTTIVDFHRGGDHRVIGQEYLFDPTFRRYLKTSGGFALMRWEHKYNEDHDITIQTYYDRTNRDWIATLEKQDNFEIDIKNRRQITDRRERVSGLTWRSSKGRFFGTDFEDDGMGGLNVLDPYQQLDRLDIDYLGGFVQEKWTLKEDKWFSWLGTKVSWNSLNGFNAQPSARSLYVINDKSVLWGAVSRAVRLPTRFDAGIQLEDPTVNFFTVTPTPRNQLISESVMAYELGYRKQPTENFNWELTGFYNVYEDLLETGPLVSYFGPFLPAPLDDLRSDGHAYGAELNGTLNLGPYWDIRGGYSYLNLDIDMPSAGFPNFGPHLDNDRSPDHMVYIQSLMQLTGRCQWDNTLRYMDNLPGTSLWEYDPSTGFNLIDGIPSYIQLDTRFNLQVNNRLDLTVVGRNLLQSAHAEFGGDEFFVRQIRSYLKPSVYLQLSWKTGRVSRREIKEREDRLKRQRLEQQRVEQLQTASLAPDQFWLR